MIQRLMATEPTESTDRAQEFTGDRYLLFSQFDPGNVPGD